MSTAAAIREDLGVYRLRRRDMLSTYAARIGREVTPTTVRLSGGDAVQVDGATAELDLLVEVDAHDDPAAEGLRARIEQALLTLSLVGRHQPQARRVLLVPSEEIRQAALAWVPGLARQSGIAVETPQR